ncbi:MAG: transglutaminase-like domain-containing protein [Vulcanimicrobiota bacterium]
MNTGRIFTLILVLFLLQGTGAQTPAEFQTFAEESLYDVWYGIYAGGQKLGYYHLASEISDDGRHYVVNEQMVAISTFAGERSEDRSELTISYSLQDGMISSSRLLEAGGGEELLITAERLGDQLRLTAHTGERPELRTIDMPQTSLAREMRFVRWMREAREGEEFESFSLDWSKDPVDIPQTFIFKSQETTSDNGAATILYNLQERSFELTEESQYDHRGVPVWQKVGSLLEIKREPAEMATQMGDRPVEILVQTTVKSDVKLGKPPLYELVLQAEGLGDFRFPEATYQQVRYLPNGRAVLSITPPQEKPEPEPLEDRERYLKATPSLQSEAPEIKQLLDSLELADLSERQAVEKLTRWVYSNLEKVSNVNAGTSLSVLKNRAGDCTEHTLLLTTLLRAAGLPAREISGLVYTNDALQVFGYHAWVEVYLDGGWLAVDPTFGQVPADASHLLLSREDSLAELQILGTLKLRVERMRSKTRRFSQRAWTGYHLQGVLMVALVGAMGVGVSKAPRTQLF